MSKTLSIVLASGTIDKIAAAGVITSGAVANGIDVNIFVTFWALMKFRKNDNTVNKLSYDGSEISDLVLSKMNEKKIQSGIEMIRNAKEVGNVHVYGCALMADVMGISKDDLDDMVEDIIGVGEFVSMTESSYTTLFI
ncbi:hypothetical protein [Thermoplasma volcanium GSS1]|uniref:Peroxiredoxin n=1 Tax=Thermoplasma volcanium (strain ATCC 51530 / DSM 4299 / JCM 9571 / NBRC 15438 / GSS1) TaxID=273116 RepID=Q977Y9_THEVO|nr:DsrE/DsrF/DrsH-like family protein [Thermoplasma volcanium]BAB60414.1 hypothetical protein [Thermoplasma volcanium GSS1]BAB60603.1 hypothetical protein [Thermoplasma volcanium GSS1]